MNKQSKHNKEETPVNGTPHSFELSLNGISVMLAMPVGRPLEAPTSMSILKTQHAMIMRSIPFSISFQTGCPYVDIARNECANDFLNSDRNVFFSVDSDMEWEPDDFLRLLAFSTQMDVVGATYVAKREGEPAFMLSMDAGVMPNEYGCFPIKNLGLGFTAVNRNVMETLAEKAPRRKTTFLKERPPIPRIFRRDMVVEDTDAGEDTAFFYDCREAGFSTWMDPMITLGHIGPKVYKASFLEVLQKKAKEVKVAV